MNRKPPDWRTLGWCQKGAPGRFLRKPFLTEGAKSWREPFPVPLRGNKRAATVVTGKYRMRIPSIAWHCPRHVITPFITWVEPLAGPRDRAEQIASGDYLAGLRLLTANSASHERIWSRTFRKLMSRVFISVQL